MSRKKIPPARRIRTGRRGARPKKRPREYGEMKDRARKSRTEADDDNNDDDDLSASKFNNLEVALT